MGLEAEFREEAFDAEDGAEILDINEEEKGNGNGKGIEESTPSVNAKSDRDSELSNYEG